MLVVVTFHMVTLVRAWSIIGAVSHGARMEHHKGTVFSRCTHVCGQSPDRRMGNEVDKASQRHAAVACGMIALWRMQTMHGMCCICKAEVA